MFFVPMHRHVHPLSRSIDRLFDAALIDRCIASATRADSGAEANPPATAARSPALAVSESDQAYTVSLEMPGVGKDDIKVAIDGRQVSVEAAAAAAKEIDDKAGDRIIYRERSASNYARRFTLPLEVDQAESAAKMEHGVLTLTLAKRGVTKATQLTVN